MNEQPTGIDVTEEFRKAPDAAVDRLKPETPITATADRIADILEAARTEAAMPPVETAPAAVDPAPATPAVTAERLEMRVEHLVEVQQRHLLRGDCPKCKKPIETSHAQTIAVFESGRAHNCHCVHCNAQLVVPGKVEIVTPGGAGRVLQMNQGPNRHQRRVGRKLPPPGLR